MPPYNGSKGPLYCGLTSNEAAQIEDPQGHQSPAVIGRSESTGIVKEGNSISPTVYGLENNKIVRVTVIDKQSKAWKNKQAEAATPQPLHIDEGVIMSQRTAEEFSKSDSYAAKASQDNKGNGNTLWIPCLAVFSSNYNFVVTSIALYIMKEDPIYHATITNVLGNGTIKMLSYAGAIVGMCVMGYLGDLIGRRLAMIFTLFLVILGALGSSLFTWGNALCISIVMGLFRFVLGVGSGGVYPLSAVTAAEGGADGEKSDRSMRVSWAYSMNVPGILFPYVLALFIWYISNHNVEISFRVLLGFGAIPAFLVWIPTWRMKDDRRSGLKDFARKFLDVFSDRQYYRQLLGTGVCWFMYDVTAYGILLVQPDITKVIFGENNSTVHDLIIQNIILNCLAFPGCYMGILVLRQMGVKWLQFWGFMGLTVSAWCMALTSYLVPDQAMVQMVLLCVVNFFINWGASITTFILPSVVFPPDVRSTYSGISAALGKVGAVVGIYLMNIILQSVGLPIMMIAAGIPTIIAAVLTFMYVDPVYSSFSYSVKMCFNSLLASIPFVDFRGSNDQ